uniref:uncharacterized protein LOC120335304 n=1 Tax=Styela clava TaxID=7725 RepID=UPI001939402F|nr:uncharacterized protein LOC120335304 [Styela clava]
MLDFVNISCSKSKLASKNFYNLAWIFAIVACCLSTFLAIKNHERMKRFEKTLLITRNIAQKHSVLMQSRIKREIQEYRNGEVPKLVIKKNEKNKKKPMENLVLESGGTTYVRWGRRDCPEKTLTSIVYSGVAAGTHYSHGGGAAKYICIFGNITYDHGRYVEGSQGSSHIYGVEYRDSAWTYPLFNLSETENNALQFHSVPCALCMAEAMVAQIMIPGRESCPKGWMLEYRGYIMAGGHGDTHTSNFICVDETPQVVPGTNANDKGSFLFMVEPQCPSLLCEPFVVGRELRCVVCTM